MKQRGRKSKAKLSVIPQPVDTRPPAPDDLLPHERELWNAITANRVADFFDDATLPLLSEYCRLKTQVDMLADKVEECDSENWLTTAEGLRRYKSLTSIRDQAQGRMIALARTMRLTQRSRVRAESASNKPTPGGSGGKIWQRSG